MARETVYVVQAFMLDKQLRAEKGVPENTATRYVFLSLRNKFGTFPFLSRQNRHATELL
jgi:hypothetical protein